MTDATVTLRRPPGKWVPPLQLMQIIALPLVLGCYLGVAEAMRDRAVAMVTKRADNAGLVDIVGMMENELACARIAHRDMVEAACTLDTELRRIEPHLHGSHSRGTRGSARR